jgi:hypothetical protein
MKTHGESTITVLVPFSLKDNHTFVFTYSPDYTIVILWSWSSSFEDYQSVWHIYLMLKWSEWMSDCYLMPIEQFFSSIMSRTCYIMWDDSAVHFVLNQHA